MTNLSLYAITAFIILDASGNTVLSKYYDPLHPAAPSSKTALPSSTLQGTANPFKTTKEQRAFEKGLFDKTRKQAQSGDILLFSNHLVLFKHSIDAIFYVVGKENENELILQSCLMGIYDAISLLLKHQVEKRAILENLDLVVLAVDESVDDGIILETDSTAIASRCSRPRPDPASALNLSELKIDEQSLLNAFSTVRDRVVSRIGQI